MRPARGKPRMGADSAETAHRMTGYYRQLDQAALAPLWESLAGLAPRASS